MKKKILMIIILLVSYILFVTVDCIKLGYAKSETKPIITVHLSEYENKTKYTGLGYSVLYYKDGQEDIYGAEFKLFDTILIWAWIE